MNDPRALSFIVYQKIQQELSGQDQEEDLSSRRAGEIILDALNLLPEITVQPGPRDGFVLIRSITTDRTEQATDTNQEELLFNLQDFVDSLRTVWQDYRKQIKRVDAK